MKTFRAFQIKYISATDKKASKVSIHDLRFNKHKIISYDYDYEYNNIYQIAEVYLSGVGINCVGVSETPMGYILFTDNFTVQI